ncbi:unnamed protein product [Effrenium voratum]|nr:unnamed protein product [Effrenium voratum]
MDQSPLAARNLTIRVSVVSSSGDLLFEGVDWYTLLSTGMSRAVKRGVGSVQENWRTTTVRKLEDVMADIERGVVSQMLVFRHAFEKEDVLTFPDFVAHVTQVPLAAPFYIVAAGTKPGEGVAIARNLTGADGIDQLADADDFYLCQCNTDRWLPDDVLDPRRTAAERLLRDMGQAEGATQMGLFAVSSAYPVHNPHTAYTAVMSAATGLGSWGQDDPAEWTDRPFSEDRLLKRTAPGEVNFFEVYEIGELLGSGSFGQVRRCWPLHDPTTRYAVKAIDTKSEVFEVAGAWLSARKEASILQSVSHPHIVKLIEVFEKERWLFLVMDYIVGGQLFQALANPRIAVTEGCLAQIGRQLIQALQHLHARRIVHRDVKAENIMLLDDPAKTRRWHIKLIDFGLAVRMESSSSFMFRMCQQEPPLEHLVCGTAYYCAPEVWFHDYSPSVDIWAAGVVLYLALFGQFPFHDRDPSRLEVLICEEDKEPAYRPICAQDHPGYQASNVAIACVKQLLTKERWERWNRRRQGVLRGGTKGSARSAGSVAGIQLLGIWDQVIPPSLRLKAGRAALPPAIEAAAEEKRTQALEAVKMRSSMVGKASLRRVSRQSSRESWSSNPFEAEFSLLEPKGLGMPVLQDIVSTAAYSDSDGEEFVGPRLTLLCSCENPDPR